MILASIIWFLLVSSSRAAFALVMEPLLLSNNEQRRSSSFATRTRIVNRHSVFANPGDLWWQDNYYLVKKERARSLIFFSVPGGVSSEDDTHYLLSTDDAAISDVVNIYSPDVKGGCVKNKADHVRLLDQSLEKSSGLGIFRRINDILWQEAAETSSRLVGTSTDGNNSNNNSIRQGTNDITTAQELDQNERFGILSHGLQDDPIYNYGNRASLELFEQTLENLCQTPSRYSTVESLMDDREQLIQQINNVGYGTLSNALRTTTKGKLFVIKTIWIWHVYDDDGRRIGLAALYDRAQVKDYNTPDLPLH